MNNKFDKNKNIFYALSKQKGAKNKGEKGRKIIKMSQKGQDYIEPENKYNFPLYYPAEVSRFVKINVARVNRWLSGYEYEYEFQKKKQPPIVRKKWENINYNKYASFYDLIDLLFIKRFLDYGFSLQKLRKVFNEAEQILGTPHFVHQSFFTDGRSICLKVKNKGGAILELLSGGQWVISEIIIELAHQIDFDTTTKFACRWFPPEGNQLVVLDPWISFGRPTIFKKGIMTENIYGLYIAENRNEQAVSNWMSLENKEVIAAANFEERLAA